MVRKVIKITTCDHCAHDQQLETDATRTIKVQFDRSPKRSVDLCDDHASLWDKIKIIATTRGH